MSNVLADIIRHKITENRLLPEIDRRSLRPSDRDFAGALRGRSRQIIAELKLRSPSCGVLCSGYRPDEIARRYEQSGAVALSVLTDEKFFGGLPTHLTQARVVTSLPVLRKDFIIEERQVLESRRIGADACLLIVGALEQNVLRALKTQIEDLGMVALVEVHDERELETALATNPTWIGINNRNLKTFETSLDTTYGLLDSIPDDVLVVTESGIGTRNDVIAMREHNVHCFLVGEAFMRAADPGAALRELFN